jgi:hypothetical protein
MSELFQIRAVWTGPGGLPGTNTLYAPTDIAIGDVLDGVNDLYDFWVTGNIADDFHVTVPSTGERIESDTGQVVGTWSHGTDTQHDGTDTSNFVTDATQVLLQLRTGFFVAGRELRGRLFLPGLRVTGTTVGNLDPDIADALADAANAALAATCAVFSRTHHEWATIDHCDVWSELAVLRSRRG